MPERIDLVSPFPKVTEEWGGPTETDLSLLTESAIREYFSSAGVLPFSPNGLQILLGSHLTDSGLSLWGPFAGGRLDKEAPEETAIREGWEELGFEGQLNPPTILVNAMRAGHKDLGNLNIGLIFPTVAEKVVELGFRENEEIHSVRWFNCDDVAGLMDEYRPDLRLWGGVYTWALLKEWFRAVSERKTGSGIVASMNSLVVVEAFFFGETPYQKIKEREKEG